MNEICSIYLMFSCSTCLLTRPQRHGPWAWSSPPASVEWVPATCSGRAVRPQLRQTFEWNVMQLATQSMKIYEIYKCMNMWNILWNGMNLGTRRHALSIGCQEEPTFEKRRRKESQVSFKARMGTGHHWHVRPPTFPELGPLLFSQWNDIFLHTHVTLLHMNSLKDRRAQHFQHLKFKMCEDWRGIWKNGNLRTAEIWQFVFKRISKIICFSKKKRAIWPFSRLSCHFGGFQAREATGRLRPATPGGKDQTRGTSFWQSVPWMFNCFCRGKWKDKRKNSKNT